MVASKSSSNNTQFTLVVADKVPASSTSALNSLSVGDQVLASISLPNPFLVDTLSAEFAPGIGSFSNWAVGRANSKRLLEPFASAVKTI